jgi:hypothetical protein
VTAAGRTTLGAGPMGVIPVGGPEAPQEEGGNPLFREPWRSIFVEPGIDLNSWDLDGWWRSRDYNSPGVCGEIVGSLTGAGGEHPECTI